MARIAALVLFACALRAQSVEITFTNSATRAPIAGLTVTLRGPAEFIATTDGGGVARIANAPPGYYRLGFRTGGYMPSPKTGKPILVGGEPVRVAFEMMPYGKLQGRVLFPDGAPALSALVILTPYRRSGGMMARTDEQGRFTFAQIFPGRFTLAAVATGGPKPPEGEAWAPASFSDALILRPDADLSGYDLRLRSVPVHHIRGTVRDDAGGPAPGAAISLIDAAGPTPGQRKSVSGDDGAFDLPDVRSGEWRLVATFRDLKGVEPLTVARRDLDAVEIRLARPFTIEATVERDVLKPATAVSLVPESDRPELEVLAFHDEDGAAILKNVYPGKYQIAPMGVVAGYYLDSIKLGDRDVLGQFVDLFEGVPPIRVVYQSGAAVVRANVENGAGAFVVLVPQVESLRTDQFIRSAAVGSDVTNLRPGDYYAFAFDRYDRLALEDPGFLRGLIPRAGKVHVGKGETATVELNVTRWPE